MKKLNYLKFFAFIVCLTQSLACAPKDNIKIKKTTPKELALQDIETMKSTPYSAGYDYDIAQKKKGYKDWYAIIFQGYSGSDLYNYFSERVTYLLDTHEHEEILKTAKHKPYATLKNNFFAKGLTPISSDMSQENRLAIAARNPSVLYWLLNVVNDADILLYIDGKWVSPNSSRVGIIEIGKAYTSNVQTFEYGANEQGVHARISTLLHEARHSDCPQGITTEELRKLRNGSTLTSLNLRSCGQLHSACPKGSGLEGINNCDNQPWGPFSIEAIYLDAQVNRYQGLERTLIQVAIADAASRLDFDIAELLRGELGLPNMESQGIIDSIRTH